MKSKKGQVNGLSPAILALVIAAIFLVLGLVIVQQIRDVDIVAESESATVFNETLTDVNNYTADQVATVTQPAAANFVLLRATNFTDGMLINAANYSFFDNGTIIATTAGGATTFNGSDWNVSYTYTYGGQVYIGSNDTIGGMATFSSFWEIIVLAVIIGIVITLLLMTFGGRRAR